MVDPELFRRHTELTGEIICQICCESKPREEMEPVRNRPGWVWDVCKECVVIDGHPAADLGENQLDDRLDSGVPPASRVRDHVGDLE